MTEDYTKRGGKIIGQKILCCCLVSTWRSLFVQPELVLFYFVSGKDSARGTKRKAADDDVTADSGVDSESDYDDAVLTSKSTSKANKKDTKEVKKQKKEKQVKVKPEADVEDDSDSSSSSDDDDEMDEPRGMTSSYQAEPRKALNKASKDGFEIVSATG